MNYQVRVTAPGLPHVRYRLGDEGPWVLGTAPDCDIPILTAGVSRHHLRLSRSDGKLFFEDLESTNGTFLNGERVSRGLLAPGAALQMGLAILLVEDTITDVLALAHHEGEVRVSSLVEVRTWSENHLRGGRERTFGVAEMTSLLDLFVRAGARHEAWETLCGAFAEAMGCRAAKCYWIQGEDITLRAECGAFPGERVPPALARACAHLPYVATFEKRDPGQPPIALLSMPVKLAEGRAVFVGLLPQGTDPVRGRLDSMMALPVLFRLVLAWSGELERAGRVADDLREAIARAASAGTREEDAEEPLLGASKALREAAEFADRVAPTESTVLIVGETGTGKELLALRIHRRSGRSGGPFLAVNCAAIPGELLEAELFGAEKGAYTGSVTSREGLVRAASGGTLFLDEVADLPPALQAKLLRFLDDRTVTPLGGRAAVRADVRVLSATHRNLRQAVADGSFREDLYFRLAVVELLVPPLRERGEDVLLLAHRFLEYGNREFGRDVRGFEEGAAALLRAHRWPGNVRELMAAVKKMVVAARGRTVTEAVVRQVLGTGTGQTPSRPDPMGLPWPEASDAFERAYFVRQLELAEGSADGVAKALGMKPRDLARRFARLGISPDGA